MVSATENSIYRPLVAPQSAGRGNEQQEAPPGLHRCLLASFSQQRAELLKSAAESQAWQAVVCSSVDQFLRGLFRLRVSLTVVDLPNVGESHYAELCNAAGRVGDISDSLVVVCGYGEQAAEEIWARQLGAWAYLPEAGEPKGWELVFAEARQAVENQIQREKLLAELTVGSPEYDQIMQNP